MRLSASGMTPKQIGAKIGKSGDAVWQRLKRRDDTLPKAAFQGSEGFGSESPLSAPRVTPKAASPEPSGSPEHRSPILDALSSAVGAGWKPIAGIPLEGAVAPPGAADNRSSPSEAVLELTAADEIPQAPAIHTSRTKGEAYLIVSDLQVPFEHERALRFCLDLVREYNVRPENIYNVGDEVDFHAFSRWGMDSEATLTPLGELAACRERLAAWYGYFPQMKLCLSNHGDRILKKAAGIQLPSQLIRTHAEILAAPPEWRWAPSWLVKGSKHTFEVLHGHEGGQSVTAQRQRSLFNGRSSVWGHLHASPGVHPAQTRGQSVWGCCSGSLIDRDAYAFHYNKGDTFRPWIGCAVIKDGGLVPVLEPLQ